MVCCVPVEWSVSRCRLWEVGLSSTCTYPFLCRRLENLLWCAKVGLLVAGLIFSVETLCLALVTWGVLPFGYTPCVVHPEYLVCACLDHLPEIHLYCEEWWVLACCWHLCAVWRGQMLCTCSPMLCFTVFSNVFDGFDLVPVGGDGCCELPHEWQQWRTMRFEFCFTWLQDLFETALLTCLFWNDVGFCAWVYFHGVLLSIDLDG